MSQEELNLQLFNKMSLEQMRYQDWRETLPPTEILSHAYEYSVLYCVLKDRNATDGITNIMVRAEDASKINRIFERFQFATVDMAELKQEIERGRDDVQEQPAPASEQDTDALLDEMLSPPPDEKDVAQEESLSSNPSKARFGESPPSGPISTPKETGEQVSSDSPGLSRPSVRQALKEIQAEQRKAAETLDRAKNEPQKSPEHKALKKKKPKKQKAR